MKNEAQLQSACIKWFALSYPKYKGLLFAIPNGGSRNILEAINLKRQGVLAGVADVFLAVPSSTFHGLFIEFKYGKNKQQESQREFMINVLSKGYSYQLIYSFDEFEKTIELYLKN